jgi:hypothetical protein
MSVRFLLEVRRDDVDEDAYGFTESLATALVRLGTDLRNDGRLVEGDTGYLRDGDGGIIGMWSFSR